MFYKTTGSIIQRRVHISIG